MFSIDKIKKNIWLYQKNKYLKNYTLYALNNLSYFAAVRESNPFRQNIGRSDFTMHQIPSINDKKSDRYICGNSEYVMKELLKYIAREQKKLKRLKCINLIYSVSNSSSSIRFENGQYDLSIKYN